MSSSSGLNLPCKVPMVEYSSKSQPSNIPRTCSKFMVISKHKGKHQVLSNTKFQPLGRVLRLPNSSRYRNMVFCNNSPVGPEPVIPPSSTPPSPGSWKPWILGVLMSVILPMWRGKWLPLLKFKQEAEIVIDTVEVVTDIVEKVAEEVEKVADEVGDLLPEGKLKDALEIVEDLADDTADVARVAGEFIDKVEDMVDQVEEKLESIMESNSGDEEAKEEKGKATHA